jgi:hypothetical protein
LGNGKKKYNIKFNLTDLDYLALPKETKEFVKYLDPWVVACCGCRSLGRGVHSK